MKFPMLEEQIEIRLRLNNMEELFAEPTANPFDPDSRYLKRMSPLTQNPSSIAP